MTLRHDLLRFGYEQTYVRHYQSGCIAIRLVVDPDGCWHWKVWRDGWFRSVQLEAPEAQGYKWGLDDARNEAEAAFVTMVGT